MALALIVSVVWIGTASADSDSRGRQLPGRVGETVPVSFQTENGWWFDGLIERPAAQESNGWAVMLLGGGLATDIDWLVPGLMTLDGNPTRDALAIRDACLARGFTVMRWSGIRRDDPQHAKDPLMADVAGFEHTVEQARLAWKAFQAKGGVPAEKVFLVGHSLGARRAGILTAEQGPFAGLVTLAGAGLVNEKYTAVQSQAEAAAKAMSGFDVDDDGRLDRTEFKKLCREDDSFRLRVGAFRRIDSSKDSSVDRHELLIHLLARGSDDWADEPAV